MSGDAHRPRALAALVALGLANAAWAGFLWSELIVARSGGTPFCAADGQTGCSKLWDSAFAGFVHTKTGLPIAAWGVLWSLLALVFPLLALMHGPRSSRTSAARSAVLVVAAAGFLSVVGLGATSLLEGAVCTGCLGTYALVLAYSATAVWARERGSSSGGWRGVAWSGAGLVAGYLALLYPGLATPKSGEALPRPAPVAGSPSSSEAEAEDLSEMLSALPAATQEALAGMLLEFSVAPTLGEAPRALMGDPRSPVILTEFSDALCGHCARLHTVLRELEHRLPAGSFALESRQFPLDPACNPNIPGPRRVEAESVRCQAAKIRICLEGTAAARDFSERMFRDQLSLDAEKLLELARPYSDLDALQRCVGSEETAAKLREDIEYALRHDIRGTPMVLINGRKGSSFPPFLLAVITAGADLSHPAFRVLPPPKATP